MPSKQKDLGLVTAYGYAVEGGYKGTEAEFMELLGDIQRKYNDSSTFATNASNSASAAANSAKAASDSQTAAANSAKAASDSQTAAANSAKAAADSQTAAAKSEGNASDSKDASVSSAKKSADSAKLAESYAVGGTGTRADEDTTSAKYYAGVAEQFSSFNAPKFHVNFDTMELIMDTATDHINFTLDADKQLFYQLNY